MACLEHDRFVQMPHENDNESLLFDGRVSPVRHVHSVAEILKAQTDFAAKIAGQKYLQHHHTHECKVEHKLGDGLHRIDLHGNRRREYHWFSPVKRSSKA